MYNKVEYNGETLIDLTDTTAEESDVLQGKQFHDRSGALRNGNFVPQTYTAGTGIDITNNKISAKVDDDTIQTNKSGQLEVNEDKIASKDYVDTEIETNEYNDIFNIRVEWDRRYMPNAELIRISFQEYRDGGLADRTIVENVKDIANGNVYLYKNTGDQWEIAVGTPPSSYHRLPMLVGNIATKTVNGESIKLFFRNGDDETQFDKLNSEKADKEGNWQLIDTITVSDNDISQVKKNVDGNGNELNLKGIAFYISCPKDDRASANTFSCTVSPTNNYTADIGRLYRQSTVGRTATDFYWEIKAKNGYWNDGLYNITQDVTALMAQTQMSLSASDSLMLNRRQESVNPYIKSWKLSVNTIPVGTTIQVFGIK